MYYFGFGLNGCAIAVNITYFLCYFGLRIAISKSRDPTVKECIVDFNMDTLSYLTVFMRLAISGLLLTCMEVWCSEGI